MNIYELIKKRRTIRKFQQNPIPTETLIKLTDAARVAPSAANIQPLKYIIINSEEMTSKIFPLVKWAGYLAPDYNPKDDERPTAYIAVFADLSLRKAGFEADSGAAVENVILAALEEGIGACWMGAIDHEKITTLLMPGDDLKLLYIIALGYPAETPVEASVDEENIKYYLDETGTLNVPKRSLDEVLIKTL